MSNKQFAANVQKWVDKAKARLEAVVTETRVEVYNRLVLKSPVDTGRFRANWHLEGQPYTYTDDKTSSDGSEFLSKLSELAKHDVVYILNALPYARVLEYGLYGTGPGATVKTTRDGYSVQAAYGMVRITAVEWPQIVREAVEKAGFIK